MKFSIITATFNSCHCLPQAMDSVLTQSFDNLEYILIDGGSTDGTLGLIREAAERDPRIHWISEPDEGIADAFNKGLAMATGEWIGILNSDDFYAPDALKMVAETVLANSAASVVHGDLLRLDQSGAPLFLLKPNKIENNIWRQMPLNHPATFVSQAAYERVGNFDKTLCVAMDYDLVLRLFKGNEPFVYLAKVLAHMRYGGASDDRLWDGLCESREISVRHGYPACKAAGWMCYRGIKGVVKRMLRAPGLTGLLTCHPRFRRQGKR